MQNEPIWSDKQSTNLNKSAIFKGILPLDPRFVRGSEKLIEKLNFSEIVKTVLIDSDLVSKTIIKSFKNVN